MVKNSLYWERGVCLDSRAWSVGCEVLNVEYGMWSMVCGAWYVQCGIYGVLDKLSVSCAVEC